MTAAQISPKHFDACHLPPDLPEWDNLLADPSAQGDLADPGAKARAATLVSAFNADATYAERHLAENVRDSAQRLIPEEEQTSLPPQARAILDRYAVIDALAIHYRDRTNSIFVWLLVIAFLTTVVLESFAHLVAPNAAVGDRLRWIIWLNPALWLGAFGLWLYAHRRMYQAKYQDYRALAEGMRVQFFWTLVGLRERIEEHYLRKQKGELQWIRWAIAWWRKRDQEAIPAAEVTTERSAAHKDLTQRRWVQEQFRYFTEFAGPREVRRGKRCKRWSLVLLWTSIVLTILLGAHEVAPERVQIQEHGFEALIVAITTLLAGAAVVIAYGEKMAFAEHARQFAGTGMFFQRYAKRPNDRPLTLEDFRDLGTEALRENGDWLLIHRDRPLEVIVA